jgi:hypothetical protein
MADIMVHNETAKKFTKLCLMRESFRIAEEFFLFDLLQ